MEPVILIGASGHAKVIIDIIERAGQYHICGLIDRAKAIGDELMGYPIIGQEEEFPELLQRHQARYALVAIGDNWTRAQVVQRLRQRVPGLHFATAIHPAALIGRNVTIGEGTVAMGGVVINSDARIGSFGIINTNSSVGHDCLIGDYVSLLPGTTVGGGVRIGDHTAVCLGSRIIHQVTIGSYTVIGAGSTVLKDIPDHVLAFGSPARVIRSRTPDEKYL